MEESQFSLLTPFQVNILYLYPLKTFQNITKLFSSFFFFWGWGGGEEDGEEVEKGSIGEQGSTTCLKSTIETLKQGVKYVQS